MDETEYEKYVLALPDGQIRQSKLFAFAGKVNGMTVDEVLETSFKEEDFAVGSADADKVVRIMTIHGSKGLEFDVVFLVGVEKPSSAAYAIRLPSFFTKTAACRLNTPRRRKKEKASGNDLSRCLSIKR